MLAIGVALLAAAIPSTASAKPSYRIISGSDIPISRVPFQVTLRESGSQDEFCGGSIVDATHVVTAGHCAVVNPDLPLKTPSSPSDITVAYGSARQSSQADVAVSGVSVPTEYTQLGGDSYDVAVLTLASPGITLNGTTAAAVPLANAHQPKSVGNAFVSGFGTTVDSQFADSSPSLLGVRVPLRSDTACSNVYGSDYVAARAVCAGGGSASANNPDTCYGDSGGPLVVDIDNSSGLRYVLLGLTSFGNGCGTRDPAVYTYTQGSGIQSFIAAHSSATVSATYTSGNLEGLTGSSGASSTAKPKDTTRPKARVSAIKCRRRKCAFRVRTSDIGGSGLKKLSAKLTRRARSCTRRNGKRRCKTRIRTRHLRPHKIRGGYRMTAKLRVARYKLSAVATDKSGNRSKTATKRFRVHRR